VKEQVAVPDTAVRIPATISTEHPLVDPVEIEMEAVEVSAETE
jgi:hypothetical protein